MLLHICPVSASLALPCSLLISSVSALVSPTHPPHLSFSTSLHLSTSSPLWFRLCVSPVIISVFLVSLFCPWPLVYSVLYFFFSVFLGLSFTCLLFFRNFKVLVFEF